MKRSTRAALLSAFIFPGIGHFTVGRPLVGLLLVLASLCGGAYLTSEAVRSAMRVVDQLETGDFPPTTAGIADLASKAEADTNTVLPRLVSMGLCLCWLIGIVDSYRIGRRQDAEATGRSPP